MRIWDEFEKFVNSLKIGDKLYEYRTGQEIRSYTVEYKHIDYKIHIDSLSTLEILLFIKDDATGRVIKNTLDDAEWILDKLYKSLGPIKNIIKDELDEVKEEIAWRSKKMNKLQNLYNSIYISKPL